MFFAQMPLLTTSAADAHFMSSRDCTMATIHATGSAVKYASMNATGTDKTQTKPESKIMVINVLPPDLIMK